MSKTAPAGAFSRADYERLEGVEERSFWFRGRNELIVWALANRVGGASTLLEIGCGNGFVLAAVERAMPALELTGCELSEDALAIARRRTERAKLLALDARELPFREEFDVVCAFDVLEHIPGDEEAMAALRRAARAGGHLLATVPQHPRLWGPSDDYAGHVRRYTRRELVAKLRRNGFEPELVTSFVTANLPAMAASRLAARRTGGYEPSSEHDQAERFNRLLGAGMKLDLTLIRRGVSLPAGGSLFCVARAV